MAVFLWPRVGGRWVAKAAPFSRGIGLTCYLSADLAGQTAQPLTDHVVGQPEPVRDLAARQVLGEPEGEQELMAGRQRAHGGGKPDKPRIIWGELRPRRGLEGKAQFINRLLHPDAHGPAPVEYAVSHEPAQPGRQAALGRVELVDLPAGLLDRLLADKLMVHVTEVGCNGPAVTEQPGPIQADHERAGVRLARPCGPDQILVHTVTTCHSLSVVIRLRSCVTGATPAAVAGFAMALGAAGRRPRGRPRFRVTSGRLNWLAARSRLSSLPGWPGIGSGPPARRYRATISGPKQSPVPTYMAAWIAPHAGRGEPPLLGPVEQPLPAGGEHAGQHLAELQHCQACGDPVQGHDGWGGLGRVPQVPTVPLSLTLAGIQVFLADQRRVEGAGAVQAGLAWAQDPHAAAGAHTARRGDDLHAEIDHRDA